MIELRRQFAVSIGEACFQSGQDSGLTAYEVGR